MRDAIAYRFLADCPLDDAVRAWNDGFADYTADLAIDAAGMSARVRQDGIVPESSIVAYAGTRPMAIVLNAIAEVHGERQAWNGGTAVAADFRRRGIGRELLLRSFELYRRRDVRLASLEAIATNQPAIALYGELGFSERGTLHGLSTGMPHVDVPPAGDVAFAPPERLSRIPFYRTHTAWTSLWPNARGAVCVIAGPKGRPDAFVLYRLAALRKSGRPAIRILQAECADDGAALRGCLGALVGHHPNAVEFTAFNIPAANRIGLDVLTSAGFEPRWEQVWMTRRFD